MSTQVSSRDQGPSEPSGWARGLAFFAGALLVVSGTFQAIEGLVAIINDTFYVVTANYTFDIDTTTYGWTHLAVGTLLAAVGACIIAGQGWAHLVGMGLAMFSMLANFLFIPYYPVWAIVIIALDVAIVWALSTLFFDRV